MSVSPAQGATRPGAAAAVSISRSAVVPTGITRPSRRVDRLGRLRADLAPLGVHPVPLDVLDLDRQEGPRADVQRQPRLPDPARRQLGEQRLVEVQRRRRRRHRARAGRRTPSDSPRGPARRPGAAPRCRAAAASRRPPRSPRRAPRRRGRRRAAPRPRPSPAPRPPAPSPKPMRSPTASRLPGRASARQSPSPRRRDQRRLDGAALAAGAAPHARAAAPGSPWCR